MTREELLELGGRPTRYDTEDRCWRQISNDEYDRLLSSARENERLREALAFYAKEWRGNMEGDPGTPGLSRCWQEPTDALWDDAGRIARAALSPKP